MARYRGPRLKKCRAVGAVLPGLTTAGTLERPYPPGAHGQRRRGRPSDYKVRLVEKQKARWHYGILEKQFIRYVKEASRRKGPTGRILAHLLESRLDNMVWRMGLAATIPAARQLVVHGHVTVDGSRVDRPSYHVKSGQTIGIRAKSRNKQFVIETIEASAAWPRPHYVEFDPAQAQGKVVADPSADDMPLEVNLQAIVEFYSQKL